jgi:hypothetical protein
VSADERGQRGSGVKAASFTQSEEGRLLALTPQSFKPLSRQDAVLENERIPFSKSPVEGAFPLILRSAGTAMADRKAAIDCLAAAVYYEAGQETEEGKRAVAQVVLNRVRHPAFPNSVCGVVYQGAELRTGCQFTFTCDGSLKRRPSISGWETARRVALDALAGAVERKVGMSTHYHADYVVPTWAFSLEKVTQLGTHIFYRWRGNWGKRSSFNQNISFESTGPADQLMENTVQLDKGPASSRLGTSPYVADELANSAPAAFRAVSHKLAARPFLRADEADGKPTADETKSELMLDSIGKIESSIHD